jgi:predicted nucleic acid-binding protein
VAKELIVADTSYVGAAQRVAERRADYGWSLATTRRLKAAKLIVSVVTVGEARSGVVRARLGRSRAVASSDWLARFPSVDLDEQIARVWAGIDARSRHHGLAFSENDLWIAATAQMLGVPIVTCDRAFTRMPAFDVEVVYLASGHPAATRSGAERGG